MIIFNSYVKQYVMECDLRYCHIVSPFFEEPEKELPGLWVTLDTEEGVKTFCCELHRKRWLEDRGVHA